MNGYNGCGCADRVITLYQGDAYLAIDSRALCISSGGCAWPAGLLSPELILDPVSGGCGCPFNATIKIPGVIVDPDSEPGPVSACFDLTSAQTYALALGHHAYRYRVVAQTISGNRITLESGRVSVR